MPEGISEDEISDELLAQGKELYNQDACVLCHGADGTGSDMAPDLTDDEWLHSQGDLDGIRRTVWYGVSKEQLEDKSRPYEMNPGGGLDLDREHAERSRGICVEPEPQRVVSEWQQVRSSSRYRPGFSVAEG